MQRCIRNGVFANVRLDLIHKYIIQSDPQGCYACPKFVRKTRATYVVGHVVLECTFQPGCVLITGCVKQEVHSKTMFCISVVSMK